MNVTTQNDQVIFTSERLEELAIAAQQAKRAAEKIQKVVAKITETPWEAAYGTSQLSQWQMDLAQAAGKMQSLAQVARMLMEPEDSQFLTDAANGVKSAGRDYAAKFGIAR